MGLAAAQANLLSITHRLTSKEYELMKLSAEKLSLLSQSEDIAAWYDWERNKNCLSYNGNTDFSYSDIMGENAYAAGQAPTVITNAKGQVICNSKYADAAYKAGLPANPTTKLSPSADTFNKFMSAITGDSETNWWTALNGTKTTEKGATTVYANAEQYKDAANYIRTKYGQYPNAADYYSGGAAPEVYDPTFEDNNNWNDPDGKFNHHREYEYLQKDFTHGGSTDYTAYYAAVERWNTNVESYIKGLESSQSVKYDIATVKSLVSNSNASIPSNKTGVVKADDKVTTNPADKNSEAYKKASFYYTIYTNILTNGYVKDDNINDKAYLHAQLGNNTYRVGRQTVSEHKDFKSEKLSGEALDELREQRERKEKALEKAQADLELKSTEVQTEITALNTEKESVKTIIQKNIERSFTYLTTA